MIELFSGDLLAFGDPVGDEPLAMSS